VVAALMTVGFMLWMGFQAKGALQTRQVDDVAQLVAAFCATLVCIVAVFRGTPGRNAWAFFGLSSFMSGAGQVVWCYYALVKDVPAPFPSLADAGFLAAVPLAFAGLLLYPRGPHRLGYRLQGLLDGCVIAASLLLASWATVLGALYRSPYGGALTQIVSVAYPMGDLIVVSLVIMLISRAGRNGRIPLGLVMVGLVSSAVADSAYTYLTAVNGYQGPSLLDTGWVAGYLLIALGALWVMTSPTPEVSRVEGPTVSLVAPYLPVLAVLAVIAVQLLRGPHFAAASWTMSLVLALLVLGREALRLRVGGSARELDAGDTGSDGPPPSRGPDTGAALLGGRVT
jgi:hypothetical protein